MKIALESESRLMCAEADGVVHVNRAAVGPWETWTVEPRGQNQIALKSAHGKYLCAEGGGGGAVVANRDQVGAWETFALSAPLVDGSWIAIVSVDGHHCLSAGPDSSRTLTATATAPVLFRVLVVEADAAPVPVEGPEAGFIGTYQHPTNLVYRFQDEHGTPWQMRGYSAHLLPVCVLHKQDIRPFIRYARSLGANTLVTIGTHLSPWKDANGYHFNPLTQAAKDALSIMFDVGAEEGMRFAHGVAADFQYGLSDDDKRRIWHEQCELMDGRWNLFARCGNESNVNGWSPELFDRPNLHGVLQSAGSAGIGNAPHQAYRDFSEWEGRRTPDSGWHKCLDDAGAGIFEQAVGYSDQHKIPVPTVMIEGQFFADTDPDHVGDHRSTDPEKALQYGLQIGASCAGGAVGTSLGLEGKIDGPVAAECARQQLRGMRAAFLR